MARRFQTTQINSDNNTLFPWKYTALHRQGHKFSCKVFVLMKHMIVHNMEYYSPNELLMA